MPNPNAIVSSTVRLEPPLDRAPDEILRSESGLSVELDGGRSVRLDPDDARSPGFARVLDGLARQGLPVYVEIDPATDAIDRLEIPLVTRVAAIRNVEGGLEVELADSHARHTLRSGGTDSDDLERALREALDGRLPVLVTEDEAHDIIDVRPYAPAPDGPLPPFPEPIPAPPIPPVRPWPVSWIWWLFERLWWWVCYPWHWFKCLSPKHAQQVFNAMAATTCDPLMVPPPCIPFRYPDDGCWGRAHEMCRLMIAMGLSPEKVWIDKSSGSILHANTKNNPQCFVEWFWHVAPTLCVRGPRWFKTQRLVIDPSLFTMPVTEATWKSVQGDPAATLTETDATVFGHGGGTDPTYVLSDGVLATYRLKLLNRSIAVGPPPYANCP